MACQREPHGKMTADGACTENTNPHGWKSCREGGVAC
jgi:hypothetical protein